MSISTVGRVKPSIVYPESDGKPMADDMLQFRWIVAIQGGLEWMFNGVPNVLVAGDLLSYPVEGNPQICTAPDVMVVFGQPAGRSSKLFAMAGRRHCPSGDV
jgi:hypothetical protein